jgi:hypothetical protein
MTMIAKAKTFTRYFLDIAWPDPTTDEFKVHPDAAEDGEDIAPPRAFGRRKAAQPEEIAPGLLLNP